MQHVLFIIFIFSQDFVSVSPFFPSASSSYGHLLHTVLFCHTPINPSVVPSSFFFSPSLSNFLQFCMICCFLIYDHLPTHPTIPQFLYFYFLFLPPTNCEYSFQDNLFNSQDQILCKRKDPLDLTL